MRLCLGGLIVVICLMRVAGLIGLVIMVSVVSAVSWVGMIVGFRLFALLIW